MLAREQSQESTNGNHFSPNELLAANKSPKDSTEIQRKQHGNA